MARKMGGGPVAALETIRKRLELSMAEFSVALGYGESSYGDMQRRGEVSLTTALAAEALMRRQAPGAQDELAFVVRISRGVPLVMPVAEARTIILDGERFLLVPAEQPRRVRPEAPAHAGNGAGIAGTDLGV